MGASGLIAAAFAQPMDEKHSTYSGGPKSSLREGEIDKQKRVNQFIIRMGRNHPDESTEYQILQVKRTVKGDTEKNTSGAS